MQRSITGYHLDGEGDWVAELACGHNQHVRHRPPFQVRAWVLDPDSRDARLGTPLDCPLCERAELPEGLRFVRSGATWDEHTMPPGLLHAHHLAGGTWGRLRMQEGRLHFSASTNPPLDIVVEPGSPQAIPPDVEHEVRPLGPIRFSIDFLAVDEHTRPGATPAAAAPQAGAAPAAAAPQAGAVSPAAAPRPGGEGDEGGDPACWARLLCPQCGVMLDGGPHRPGCPQVASD